MEGMCRDRHLGSKDEKVLRLVYSKDEKVLRLVYSKPASPDTHPHPTLTRRSPSVYPQSSPSLPSLSVYLRPNYTLTLSLPSPSPCLHPHPHPAFTHPFLHPRRIFILNITLRLTIYLMQHSHPCNIYI